MVLVTNSGVHRVITTVGIMIVRLGSNSHGSCSYDDIRVLSHSLSSFLEI